MKTELQKYQFSKYSQFGYVWETIDTFDTEAEAEAIIEKNIALGEDRRNFRTRPADPEKGTRGNKSPHFMFRERVPDITHSERRRRWNSKDPREKI